MGMALGCILYVFYGSMQGSNCILDSLVPTSDKYFSIASCDVKKIDPYKIRDTEIFDF